MLTSSAKRYVRWRLVQSRSDLRAAAHRLYTRTVPVSTAAGTVIEFPAVVNGGAFITVGRNTLIRRRASLNAVPIAGYPPPRLTIGDGCELGDDLFITCSAAVTIGNNVLMSHRIYIGDSHHDHTDAVTPPVQLPLINPQPVTISDGAFLGVDSTVLPGVTIGERAVVGAGAVVTRDVEPWTLVAGNPARVLQRWTGRRWERA